MTTELPDNHSTPPATGAVGSQFERRVRPRLTPWFPHTIKPVRPGFYRWQDWTMNCGCCWCTAHWNGREWHTDLFERGRFNTLLFDSQVKRWRGLAQRPNAELTGARRASELNAVLCGNGSEVGAGDTAMKGKQ